MPEAPTGGGAALSPRDAALVLAWAEESPGRFTFTCVSTPDQRSEALRAFCRELSRLAPAVSVVFGEAEGLPALRLAGNLLFHAAPHGTELPPFLSALSGAAAKGGAQGDLLSALPEPVSLTVFTTPQCPFCPVVARDLAGCALASPGVRVAVVDAELFPERAAQDGVRSVPTVLADGGFRWTGAVTAAEVLGAFVTPAHMGREALARLLKEGAASLLGARMTGAGEVPPALSGLLAAPEWSLRLGAMVVLEHLAEEAPRLLSGVIEAAFSRLPSAPPEAAGDILGVIGDYGGPGWGARLEEVLLQSLPEEVLAAAREALGKVRGRLQPCPAEAGLTKTSPR